MMFPSPTNVNILPHHTGIWWQREHALQTFDDPGTAYGGQGIWLKATAGRFYAYHFAYDRVGERRWLAMGGSIEEGLRGVGLFDASATGSEDPEAFAAGALRFISPTQGTYFYRGGDLGIGCVDIQMLGLAGDPIDGLWYDENFVGEGFAIQKIGSSHYLYWFHADGTWDLCCGPGYDIIRPRGNGLFEFNRVEYDIVGQATFDPEEMVFSFQGSTQELQRLF